MGRVVSIDGGGVEPALCIDVFCIYRGVLQLNSLHAGQYIFKIVKLPFRAGLLSMHCRLQYKHIVFGEIFLQIVDSQFLFFGTVRTVIFILRLPATFS